MRRAMKIPAVREVYEDLVRQRQLKADLLVASALTDSQLKLPVLNPKMRLEEVLEYPRDAQRVLTHQESGLKASFLTHPLPEGRDISDPLPDKRADIERACEAPLAESGKVGTGCPFLQGPPYVG